MSDKSMNGMGRCENCLGNVGDGGIQFDGDCYCSEFCAEVCGGYWSREAR